MTTVTKPFSEPVHKVTYTYKDDGLKNFNDLKKGELLHVCKEALNKFNEREGSPKPAAGYEFVASMISPKLPLEFKLTEIGERNQGEKMKMPQIRGGLDCAMCSNEPMEGYGAAGSGSAMVIKSLEGNPLAISRRETSKHHAQHAFELSPEELEEVTLAGIKALNLRTGGTSSRGQIAFHIGVEGHQTFPHAHAHITTALGFKEEKKAKKERKEIEADPSPIIFARSAISATLGGGLVALGHFVKVFSNTSFVHGALFSFVVSLTSQVGIPILKKYGIECDKYAAGAAIAIVFSALIGFAGVTSTVSALGALVLTLSSYSAEHILKKQNT